MSVLSRDAAIVLAHAADEVEKGFCKGVLEGNDGSVCIQGAFNRVLNGSAREWGALGGRGPTRLRRTVERAVWEEILASGYSYETPRGQDRLAWWNNATERTQSEVATMLRLAIRRV